MAVSKGGKITKEDRIKAATKVYGGKVFENTVGTKYKIEIDKQAKGEENILKVTAEKDGKKETRNISPANVPFMLGSD